MDKTEEQQLSQLVIWWELAMIDNELRGGEDEDQPEPGI